MRGPLQEAVLGVVVIHRFSQLMMSNGDLRPSANGDLRLSRGLR